MTETPAQTVAFPHPEPVNCTQCHREIRIGEQYSIDFFGLQIRCTDCIAGRRVGR